MNRTYKDVRDLAAADLAEELLDLRVDHYMANPDLARELLRELLERDVAKMDKNELIDELYDEGYWA